MGRARPSSLAGHPSTSATATPTASTTTRPLFRPDPLLYRLLNTRQLCHRPRLSGRSSLIRKSPTACSRLRIDRTTPPVPRLLTMCTWHSRRTTLPTRIVLVCTRSGSPTVVHPREEEQAGMKLPHPTQRCALPPGLPQARLAHLTASTAAARHGPRRAITLPFGDTATVPTAVLPSRVSASPHLALPSWMAPTFPAAGGIALAASADMRVPSQLPWDGSLTK